MVSPSSLFASILMVSILLMETRAHFRHGVLQAHSLSAPIAPGCGVYNFHNSNPPAVFGYCAAAPNAAEDVEHAAPYASTKCGEGEKCYFPKNDICTEYAKLSLREVTDRDVTSTQFKCSDSGTTCLEDKDCKGNKNKCMNYKCKENLAKTCRKSSDCTGICKAEGVCKRIEGKTCTNTAAPGTQGHSEDCGVCVTGATVHNRLSGCTAPSSTGICKADGKCKHIPERACIYSDPGHVAGTEGPSADCGTKGDAKGCNTHATFYSEAGRCYCNQGKGWGKTDPISSTHSEIEAITEAIAAKGGTGEIFIWNDMVPCFGCAGAILTLLKQNPGITKLTVMFGRFQDSVETTNTKLDKYCYIERLCGIGSLKAVDGWSCVDGRFVRHAEAKVQHAEAKVQHAEAKI